MTRYCKSTQAIEALTPEQFDVTQHSGIEKPGTGAYLRNKELRDESHGMRRVEVRSTHGDSHLGMFLPMARTIAAACATASIRPRYDLCHERKWQQRATLTIWTKWQEFDMTTQRAVLAGGCFWGMQDLIRKMPGVQCTRVGYTGGDVQNATYRNHGNHAEGIEINFDPTVISYRRILEVFFQIHDPTTPKRQGNDRGSGVTRRPTERPIPSATSACFDICPIPVQPFGE